MSNYESLLPKCHATAFGLYVLLPVSIWHRSSSGDRFFMRLKKGLRTKVSEKILFLLRLKGLTGLCS